MRVLTGFGLLFACAALAVYNMPRAGFASTPNLAPVYDGEFFSPPAPGTKIIHCSLLEEPPVGLSGTCWTSDISGTVWQCTAVDESMCSAVFYYTGGATRTFHDNNCHGTPVMQVTHHPGLDCYWKITGWDDAPDGIDTTTNVTRTLTHPNH